MDSTVSIAVHSRQALPKAVVEEALSEISTVLLDSTQGEKLRIALELYAAHFKESQTRVRFLLLVIAIESLSVATKKHTVATDLLDRWKSELESELRQYATDSEEYQNLDALRREMSFRAEDSIRMQVRKLFASIPTSKPAESKLLQQRAVRVYDRRSTLVHDGHLPNEELASLEQEARELLETVFAHAIRGTLNSPTIETPAGGV